MPTFSTTSASFIELCGPAQPIRFGTNREINWTEFLPVYLKETETFELVEFFETFLNTLYEEYTITTSATEYEEENRTKLSILEKINRLSDLHDPDLIDIEYIQFFADMFGYSVDLNRGELGVLADQDSEDPCVIEDSKRYLRFIVKNLPHWYKIKTTNNSIKIMLYSFGLIGDLLNRYTNDYRLDTGSNWITFREGQDNFSDMPRNFYPTSHFTLSINLDSSNQNFSLNDNLRLNVLKAVESVRPAASVFDGVTGYSRTTQTMYMRGFVRSRYYEKIMLGY